jgi:hypothetical protein
MLRFLQRLRRTLFPTTLEAAEEQWGLQPDEVLLAVRGALNLGTFFGFNGMGFTEDTWPLLVVGDFLRCSDGDGTFFELSCFRRRVILDFERRTARREWAWRRRACAHPRVLWQVEDVQRLRVSAVPCFDDEGLEFQVELPNRRDRDVLVLGGAYPPRVELVASRINYLWFHGRGASNLAELPQWGDHDTWRWRNPDAELLAALRSGTPA